MNFFVADPEWGLWIILYFYLGGLAAGSYFVATLVELFGKEQDWPLSRLGFRLAFPLICVCGLLLTVDLEKPEYFWHMLFQSERVEDALVQGWPLGGWGEMIQAPMFKWWSPMSIGAWALTLFGACSGLSFLGTIWPDSRMAHLLQRGWIGRVFQVIGSVVGFFVASYTGILLSATNQPTWSVSDWIGPLFLTSAASTSIAAILLLGSLHWPMPAETTQRLERADLWALGLELFLFLIFLASLGSALPLALQTPAGLILVLGALALGLLVPLGLHLAHAPSWTTQAAAAFALIGGFLLRYGIVRAPAEILHRFGGTNPEPFEVPLVQTTAGVVLLILTVVLAIAIPWSLQRQWQLSGRETAVAGAVSLLVMIGVTLYAVQTPAADAGPDLLPQIRFSPEDGRPVGGGVGASGSNRPVHVRMRSKILQTP